MKRQVPESVKVKFRHWRLTVGEVENEPISIQEIRKKGFIVLPRGGFTECWLILAEGGAVVGESTCSKSDNYCKRIGRDIALGRALKNAEREFPELFKKEVAA